MEQADYDSKYKHLNLPLLKSYAEHWGERFPCIKRIALYLAAPDNYGTDLQYVLAANAPENRGVDSEVANYHDWADGINVRTDELSKVYKGDPPPNHNFQWMWFSLDIDESIEDYPNLNLDAYFVLPGTEYVLYEKEALFSQEKSEKQAKHNSIVQSDIDTKDGLVKTDSQEIALISKYANIGDKYAEKTLNKTGSLPTIPEIDSHIKTTLKQNNESLGKTQASVLPDRQARKVRKEMRPQNIRSVGQKK